MSIALVLGIALGAFALCAIAGMVMLDVYIFRLNRRARTGAKGYEWLTEMRSESNRLTKEALLGRRGATWAVAYWISLTMPVFAVALALFFALHH